MEVSVWPALLVSLALGAMVKFVAVKLDGILTPAVLAMVKLLMVLLFPVILWLVAPFMVTFPVILPAVSVKLPDTLTGEANVMPEVVFRVRLV